MVESTSQFTNALMELVEDSDQVEVIAVMELFAFLVFASQEATSWTCLLIFYVTDNHNLAIPGCANRGPVTASPAGSCFFCRGSKLSVVLPATRPTYVLIVTSWPTGSAEQRYRGSPDSIGETRMTKKPR